MVNTTPIKKLNLKKIGEVTLVGAFIAVIVLVASFVVKVGTGVSKTVDTPDTVVRLQILNATGTAGIGGQLEKKLNGYQDTDILVKVVDTDSFDLRKVERSFIISRERDTHPASLFAEKFGLDPTAIVYKPIEHNSRQVSVTLVLGEDYEAVKLVHENEKE